MLLMEFCQGLALHSGHKIPLLLIGPPDLQCIDGSDDLLALLAQLACARGSSLQIRSKQPILHLAHALLCQLLQESLHMSKGGVPFLNSLLDLPEDALFLLFLAGAQLQHRLKRKEF